MALNNLNVMCDVEFILGLPCILPLLKCVHMLIKIAQDTNIFVCDFVEGVKLAQHKLYRLYCDPYIKFDDPTFDDFNAIEILTNDVLPMSWFSNVNGGENVVYLAFSFAAQKYHLYQHDLFGVRKLHPITRKSFKLVMDKVKPQCDRVA
jgi:hypothetical protein